ncbi:MAG: dihydrolipoyl dehydrogenase [Firmicutes bacterium]|nr:dihydrolipoyl dehydrogenase [Bacillota bacterium]
MSEAIYDIAIIGGGPGGYASAFRAAEIGLRPVIIEKDKVGGTCVHRGCIPTTSLLQSARVLEMTRRADKFGIKTEGVSYDWQSVQKAKSVAVNRLYMGLRTLFKQHQVDVIKGLATFDEPGLVRVDGEAGAQTVRAENVIIATGSSPRSIPILERSPDMTIDTTQALEINEVPRSITIVGGGAYGVEFASLFKSFGSEVSIIDIAPHLLPREDADIAKRLERIFSKRGINIHTQAKIQAAAIIDNQVQIEIELQNTGEVKTVASDKVLVTVGRTANLDNIDTETLGLKTKDGFIDTDSDMKTNIEGVYAVGDVTFNPQYANFAFSEGIHAVEAIAGLNPPKLNLKQIPIYIFGYPELAKVGYTEDEARQAGFEIETVGLSFQAVPRSAIDKDDTGFAKMIAIKGGPIIGVHLIGPDVVNLISEAMLITNWEATAEDVAQFLHPHPTYAESIGETVLKLANKPLHSL